MSIIYIKDILFSIKQFLENNEIIELLVSCKNIKTLLGNKNLFTSIVFHKDSDLCFIIRKYLENKKSIYKTVISDISDPACFWPFCTKIMVFTDCNIKEDYIKKNYQKTEKFSIVNTRKIYTRFWH